MPIDYLALTLRLLHILAVITAVGGMVFIRFALLPAVDTLGEQQRRTLHEAVRARWARLVQLSILVLLVTGLINFWMFIQAAKTWGDEWRETYNGPYQMLFGIKFLLTLAIFALASILTGRSAGTKKIRDNPRFWLNINLAMALVVIIISGVMRLTHVGPTDPSEQRIAEPATGG
ncbi:MAG: hypothetical protein WD894_18030 [Pirellulales bacterium]